MSLLSAATIADTESSESENEDGNEKQISTLDEALLMQMPAGSQSELLNACEDTDNTHVTIFEAARDGSLEKIKSQVNSKLSLI